MIVRRERLEDVGSSFFYGDNGELKREGRLSRGPGFGFFFLQRLRRYSCMKGCMARNVKIRSGVFFYVCELVSGRENWRGHVFFSCFWDKYFFFILL